MPQYVPLGTVAAPADWVLPPSLRLSLAALFAQFDGTSAAGSYIPTVQILSDSGHTVVEVQQDSTVAAGSSVVASWAPFLKTVPAAAATSTSLPYCDVGQFRNNFNPGIDTQFRWTNIHNRLERNDPMFGYADTNTALSINSEGIFMVMAFANISFGNSALTSDRIIDWEFDTDFGYTPFGTFQAQGPLVTGQPAIAATPAGYFSEYAQMVSLNFWVGTLAAIGLSALPLKIRPVLDVNLGASNPLSLGLSMFVTRLGDAPVFV